MPEGAFQNNLEAEIAQLSAEIEQKRRRWKKKGDLFPKGEVLKETLREKIFPASASQMISTVPPTGAAAPVVQNDGHKVNQLVNQALSDGLTAAIKEARKAPVYFRRLSRRSG